MLGVADCDHEREWQCCDRHTGRDHGIHIDVQGGNLAVKINEATRRIVGFDIVVRQTAANIEAEVVKCVPVWPFNIPAMLLSYTLTTLITEVVIFIGNGICVCQLDLPS